MSCTSTTLAYIDESLDFLSTMREQWVASLKEYGSLDGRDALEAIRYEANKLAQIIEDHIN